MIHGTCNYCAWEKRHRAIIDTLPGNEKNMLCTIAKYILLSDNPTVNVLSELLGHKDINTTCNILRTIKLNKHINVEVFCDNCGKKFIETPSSYIKTTNHFCCRGCYAKYKADNAPKGEDSDYYNRIETACSECGKKIKVIPSKLRTANSFGDNFIFCSRECYYSHRSKYYIGEKSSMWGKKYSEEDRNKIAKRVLLNSRSSNRFNSKPQLLVNKMLDELGIEYEREKIVDYYAIDNYLQRYNLAIEVMGDYWHANPLKYSEENMLNKAQKRDIVKDKQKRTFLSNNYSMKILYLWESDIINNDKLCKLLIANYIDNNGVMANYNSFNYAINDDDEIELSVNVIIPFQEKNKNQL